MSYTPYVDRVVKIEADGTVTRFIKAFIESGDYKPQKGIATGSTLIERDTGGFWIYSERLNKWVPHETDDNGIIIIPDTVCAGIGETPIQVDENTIRTTYTLADISSVPINTPYTVFAHIKPVNTSIVYVITRWHDSLGTHESTSPKILIEQDISLDHMFRYELIEAHLIIERTGSPDGYVIVTDASIKMG